MHCNNNVFSHGVEGRTPLGAMPNGVMKYSPFRCQWDPYVSNSPYRRSKDRRTHEEFSAPPGIQPGATAGKSHFCRRYAAIRTSPPVREIRISTPSHSVRAILLALVLACLLPGVIGAAVLFLHQYQAGRAQQEQNLIRTARALVHAVDSHLFRVQASAEALATADSLAAGRFERFHQRAQKAVATSGLGINVVLRDKSEQLILNSSRPYGTPLPRQPSRAHVQQVFSTGKPAISDLFYVPQFKQPIMSIDVPVVIDGEVAYSLGIGLLPQHFNAILNTQKLPPDWVVGILDSSGNIAARTLSAEQFVGKKPSDALLQAMQTAHEGTIEATTGEGIQTLSFFSRSPATNWSVVIGIPSQSLTSALVMPLALMGVGVAFLFIIGLTLAWFMGGRIAHSFKALIAPAAALGEGASAPIPATGIKEAEEVAGALGRADNVLKAKDAQLAEAHLLARIGTWSWNLESGEVMSSESMAAICGREIPPFPEQRGTLLTIDSWERVNAASREAMEAGRGYDIEIQINHGSGEIVWMNAKCEAIRNDDGKVILLRGTLQDISERRRSEERVRDAALHDVLTGLPNRTLVMEYCGHLLAAAARNHARGALLFIDLDRFKPINDLYGHETGDRVLAEVSKRLVESTRNEDLVGRLGGDEFVVVLPHLGADRQRAATVAQHVINSISRPIQINGLELSVSPSIGISYFPDHADSVSALVHTADLAMYQAKKSGRATYQFYTLDLEKHAEEALSVEVRLKNALKDGNLRLHYQPVIDIKSGKLVGAEALVRLEDRGEIIAPDKFIPVAEASGLIGDLGNWVAAEACRQQRDWLNQGLELTMAINVSPLQFREQAFAEKLGGIILATGISPASIEIEVTESAVMENLGEAVEILKRIKALGVRVALDDFGTGYSSLSSLTSLPLDKLKVDQSFIRRIERDQACRAVTEAILSLGRNLRLDVHGEGIESERALHYLAEHGCNQAQGYWFSRPLPAPEFAQWYRQREAA
jgi:diguanylate cyclase (GGDEF)-like protein